MDTKTTAERVDLIITQLREKKRERDSPHFKAALDWLGYLGTVDPKRKRLLMEAMCDAFSITETQIYAEIAGTTISVNGKEETVQDESELEAKLGEEGWLRDYIEFTRYTEAPMSYHIFSSLCLLGTSLGARVYIPKGFFNIWLNYCALMIGPPAIAKTSAADIAKDLLIKAELCPIFPDKVTPESLMAAMKEYGTHQFIYAPELSVFFNRQKYNVGLVEIINRILDCPVDYKMRTMSRGEELIPGQMAVSILGASTPSLIATSTPGQTSGAGFLSRFVIVVEKRTQREFWQPIRGGNTLENKLLMTLLRMKQMKGIVSYSPEADEYGKVWYHEHKVRMREATDEQTVEVASRLATPHFERTATLLHLANHRTLVVCKQCFEQSGALMQYVLKSLPYIVGVLKTTTKSQETDFVLQTLKKLGGSCDHSKLLRACSSKGMMALQFKQHIDTLKEQGVISEVRRGSLRFYILQEE